jgi:RNA polymerase sigma-70 factor (ECF subfamily)
MRTGDVRVMPRLLVSGLRVDPVGGYEPDHAADLTQDFFARLLEGSLLGAADRNKGRFRDLLWRDCGYFLADAGDRARACKRGGGRAAMSLNRADAEHRFRLEPSDRMDPERRFERAWALGVLDRALDRLALQEEAAGRGACFREFLPFLTDGRRVLSYAVVTRRMGRSEGAVKAAVRRLRDRYRLELRREVAGTLGDPTEDAVDDEIRDLFAALGR